MLPWLVLIACVSPDAPRPPPVAGTLEMLGPELFVSDFAERPTLDIRGDRLMIGFEHGSTGIQTAHYALYDLDLQLLQQRSISRNRSNHVQVASSPWGWTLAWVETSQDALWIRALDMDGTPINAATPFRRSAGVHLGHVDLHLDAFGEGVLAWSEEAAGTTHYGIRSMDAGGLGAVRYRMRGLGYRGGPPCICGGEGERLLGWYARDTQASAVLFQSIDGDGAPVAPAVVVEQSSGPSMSRPACVQIEGGGWAVGWRSMQGIGDHQGSFLRFLDADGTPRGPTHTLDPLGEGVALAAVGDTVVAAWRDYDSDASGISMQLWSAAHQVALTPITRVNEHELGEQSSVDVTAWSDASGLHGVLAWHTGPTPLTRSVSARAFTLNP